MNKKQILDLAKVDIIGAAKQLAASPDLYRQMVGTANRRIKRLKADKYTKYSNAYQQAMKHLKSQGRKQFSVDVKAGKKNAWHGEHRSDYLGNAIELLQFTTAVTSTKTGIKKLYVNRKQNLIKQISRFANLDPADLQAVTKMIQNASIDELREIFNDYDAVLGGAFIGGSYDQFNFIGNDLASKISKYNQNKKKQATYSAIRKTVRGGVKSLQDKAKKKTKGDRVEMMRMTIGEWGKLADIDKPLTSSFMNKAKWEEQLERR